MWNRRRRASSIKEEGDSATVPWRLMITTRTCTAVVYCPLTQLGPTALYDTGSKATHE